LVIISEVLKNSGKVNLQFLGRFLMGLQTTQMHPHGGERLASKLLDLSFLPLSPPRLYWFANLQSFPGLRANTVSL
jgi:hypothetical protein